MHGDLREREAIEQACPCVSNDDKAHTGRLRVRRPGAYRCQWHTRSVKAKCTTLELVRAQADAFMVLSRPRWLKSPWSRLKSPVT